MFTGSPVTIRSRSPAAPGLVHQDLAGLDADAQAELRPVLGPERRRELGHGRLHLERGANRALGIVLVRLRHAEEGEHGVAGELLDQSLVALCLGADPIEGSSHQRLHELRVVRLVQAGEANEVGEEDRGDLALALVGCRASIRAAPARRGGLESRNVRRSRSGTGVAGSSVPHEPQNRSPGSLTAPQAGHSTFKAAPHDAQKRRPARFWVPHALQITCSILGHGSSRNRSLQGRDRPAGVRCRSDADPVRAFAASRGARGDPGVRGPADLGRAGIRRHSNRLPTSTPGTIVTRGGVSAVVPPRGEGVGADALLAGGGSISLRVHTRADGRVVVTADVTRPGAFSPAQRAEGQQGKGPARGSRARHRHARTTPST